MKLKDYYTTKNYKSIYKYAVSIAHTVPSFVTTEVCNNIIFDRIFDKLKLEKHAIEPKFEMYYHASNTFIKPYLPEVQAVL